ncbi:valacyclovir hydrolase [Penicillium angulare]|uniref:valacyclovir hydrolase n=1 Tax=Penicillium angulare TaxID=116970 RepID=UPI00254039BB|nr:valacyclovir hydrolase [Penicillium angulare]KAJ5288217.1 valacyclovir hydrolase [Penicillium angulare]
MTILTLPRPGESYDSKAPTIIKAPSEQTFISIFGQMLPKAIYINTTHGCAAYYSLPATGKSNDNSDSTIQRVLFVHGVQTPAIGLQPLASTLSRRFPSAHCVLVDLWGHGLSDTPILPHEASLFHSLLNDLLDELKWKDAHVIGYSFGGSTCASFAASYSERVSSMALVAPAGLVRSETFGEVQQAYLSGDGTEEEAKDWVFEWLEGGKLVVPYDWKERIARGDIVAEAVRDWEVREHEGHVASVVGIVRDGGVLDKHGEFVKAAETGIPSICVLGELDDLCSVQDLAEVGMKNAQVVSQVGHGVVRQKVPEVADLIENFWKGL